jgi:hypothetical protein
MIYIYRISPAIFFTLAVQICFCLPFLKYGLLLAIDSPLFRALVANTSQNIGGGGDSVSTI